MERRRNHSTLRRHPAAKSHWKGSPELNHPHDDYDDWVEAELVSTFPIAIAISDHLPKAIEKVLGIKPSTFSISIVISDH